MVVTSITARGVGQVGRSGRSVGRSGRIGRVGRLCRSGMGRSVGRSGSVGVGRTESGRVSGGRGCRADHRY